MASELGKHGDSEIPKNATNKAAELVEEICRLNSLPKQVVCLESWAPYGPIMLKGYVKPEDWVLPEGYRLEKLKPYEGKDQWMLTNEAPEKRRTSGWYEFTLRRA